MHMVAAALQRVCTLLVIYTDLAKDIDSSALIFETLHDLLYRDTFWSFNLEELERANCVKLSTVWCTI